MTRHQCDGSGRARRCLRIPASEIEPGDEIQVRDGVRHVVSVVPQVVEFALLIDLDRLGGLNDDMHVPLFQSVTVWRVGDDR